MTTRSRRSACFFRRAIRDSCGHRGHGSRCVRDGDLGPPGVPVPACGAGERGARRGFRSAVGHRRCRRRLDYRGGVRHGPGAGGRRGGRSDGRVRTGRTHRRRRRCAAQLSGGGVRGGPGGGAWRGRRPRSWSTGSAARRASRWRAPAPRRRRRVEDGDGGQSGHWHETHCCLGVAHRRATGCGAQTAARDATVLRTAGAVRGYRHRARTALRSSPRMPTAACSRCGATRSPRTPDGRGGSLSPTARHFPGLDDVIAAGWVTTAPGRVVRDARRL